MSIFLRVLSCLALALILAGLGTQSASAQSDPAAPAADPVVRVAHFAPFAAEATAASVTVRINGADVITDFAYAEVTVTSLPPGDYLVEVLPSGTETVAISGSFTLEADKIYSLLAIGDGSVEQPLALEAIVDDGTPPAAGSARLLIGHYAPFAPAVADTKVDICDDATGAPFAGLVDVPYGVNTGYLEAPAGIYDLSIALAGSNCAGVAYDIPALALVSGKTYDAFAIGKNNVAYPLMVTTIAGLDFPAKVDVAHFAPFAGDVAGTKVDIYLNGGEAITDSVYGDTYADVMLIPGDYLVEIKPDGTDTVAISGTATLMSGGSYALAAIGDGSNQSLQLAVLSNATSAPTAGNAKLRASHFAPFAATEAGTAVDICNDENDQVVVSDLVFAESTAYLELPSDFYDLSLAAAGSNCRETLLDIPTLQLNNSKIYEVYAIGKATDVYPVAVASFAPLDFPAIVTVGHVAPFAATVAETSVDIRVNGQTALTGVVFGDYFPNLLLPSGANLVEVVTPGIAAEASDAVAISGVFTLTGMTKYELFAIGDGANQPLGFSATVVDQQAPAGQALLTVGHLAPFAADINATAVDICTDGGQPVISDLKYPDVMASVALPPGLYDLEIAVAGSDCAQVALDLDAFRLVAGDVRDVFAIGNSLSGGAFPVQPFTTTGLRAPSEQYLPGIYRAQ